MDRPSVESRDSTAWPMQGFPHFDEVYGWLDPHALQLTAYYATKFLGETFNSLEIGVHHGKYFLGIERMTPEQGRCIAIDVFERQDLNIDGSGRGDRAILEANIQKWALAPSRVEVIQQDSLDIDSHALGLAQYGIISIDGGHTREHTFHDLKTAQDLLSPDGLVILDDINNQDWCGVITGALDFFNSPYSSRVVPIAIGFNKLFIVHFSVATQRKQQMMADESLLAAQGIRISKLTQLGHHSILSLGPV